MVDAIGSRLSTGSMPAAKVAAPAPVAAPESAPRSLAGAAAQLSGIAQAMASAAPVDLDRIARIKKAIADGDFPILPATIADRMIALRLNWVSRDEA